MNVFGTVGKYEISDGVFSVSKIALAASSGLSEVFTLSGTSSFAMGSYRYAFTSVSADVLFLI